MRSLQITEIHCITLSVSLEEMKFNSASPLCNESSWAAQTSTVYNLWE